MKPDRSTKINGHKIEEYYWAGKWVVYVNDRLYKGTYEEAIKEMEGQA